MAAKPPRPSDGTWLALGYLAAVSLIVSAAAGPLLWMANRAYVRVAAGSSAVTLYPPNATWWLQAGLIGFCLAILTLHRFLSSRPNLDSRAHQSVPRALLLVYAALLAFAVVISALNVRKFAMITGSSIVEQRALSLSAREYPFSEVRDVAMSRFFWSSKSSRGVSKEPIAYCWFRNGERWSTRDAELALPTGTDQAWLAGLLAERSGKPVRRSLDVVDLPEPDGMRRRLTEALVFSVGGIAVAAAVLVLARRVRSRAAQQAKSKPGA